MSVKFYENKITTTIEKVVCISKVYRTSYEYKYGMKAVRYYVYSKQMSCMTWVWADACEEI